MAQSKLKKRSQVLDCIPKAEKPRHMGPDDHREKFRFYHKKYKSHEGKMLHEGFTFNTKHLWLYFRGLLRARNANKENRKTNRSQRHKRAHNW